jgi:Haem-NO-binding
MKGMVFTEFLEMVEDKFGYAVVDEIISKSDLKSNGSYTSVGTYSSHEMIQLVNNLQINSGIPLNVLYEVFGEYLFGSLSKAYGQMFEGINNSFDMFMSIDQNIHVQVRKLYPDAELPTFDVSLIDEDNLKMIYYSERKMGDLAVGLIKGCLSHYKEKATITKRNLSEDGKNVEFIISKTK